MANASGQGGAAFGFEVENSHHFNASGVTWTPANVPAGQILTGWAYSILTYAADNAVTDSDGTVLSGIPAGFSAAGGTLGGGSINPPQIINPGTGGRIIVNFQTKAS